MLARFRPFIIGSLIWIALDQWSKIAMVDWLVIDPLPEMPHAIHSRVHDVSEAWFRLRVVGNPGAAWGMFRSLPDWARVPFFVAITTGAMAFMAYFYKQARDDQRLHKVALTFIFGGAVGNLIDRIRYGYVIDFVEWFYGDFHWPNFNVADIAITVGVALLAIDIILEGRRPAAREATTPDAPPGA